MLKRKWKEEEEVFHKETGRNKTERQVDAINYYVSPSLALVIFIVIINIFAVQCTNSNHVASSPNYRTRYTLSRQKRFVLPAAKWPRIESSSGKAGSHRSSQMALIQEVPITSPRPQASPFVSETATAPIRQANMRYATTATMTTTTSTTSTTTTTTQQPSSDLLTTSSSSLNGDDPYKCALYCSCSIIRILSGPSIGPSTKLTRNGTRIKSMLNGNAYAAYPGSQLIRAKCESSMFSDLLSLDRRTQIIHISLPAPNNLDELASGQPTPMINYATPAPELDLNLADDGGELQLQTTNTPNDNLQPAEFRMPRLNQFNQLREIVIINLKFQVCDTEVFKRGQKLRRFQLNHNKLSRLSKSCFRHLDRLLELNLDHNRLEELESALFISLYRLKSLSIAHNRLTTLAAHQFANLTQLVSLNLVGNSFKAINLHLLEPMKDSLRMLLLSRNEIKTFVYAPNAGGPTTDKTILLNNITSSASSSNSMQIAPSSHSTNKILSLPVGGPGNSFAGVLFKNLIKLNVDSNRFERIKSLQLHRFFNLKFLSIRHNQLVTIRDKAFNGLKLIELNLAHNKLQTLLKCAFCNSTIKRLVLAHNNISLTSLPSPTIAAAAGAIAAAPPALPTPIVGPIAIASPLSAPASLISAEDGASTSAATDSDHLMVSSRTEEPEALNELKIFKTQGGKRRRRRRRRRKRNSDAAAGLDQPKNMLILSQSILGPLFNQIEYLDLSFNAQLADQLDFLLEPLLSLEYLNLASTGLDKSLPSPYLFKNLHNLRYLNLSHNTLDLIVSETIEPLTQLEIFDLSHNNLIELEESFLVGLDELTMLKLVNLATNPWLCSQCRVAPLYDWVLRSSIYNRTCVMQTTSTAAPTGDQTDSIGDPSANSLDTDSTSNDESTTTTTTTADQSIPDYVDSNSIDTASNLLSLLDEQTISGMSQKSKLAWHKLELASQDLAEMFGSINVATQQNNDLEPLGGAGYNLLGRNDQHSTNHNQQWSSGQQQAAILAQVVRDFATNEDDSTIGRTINLIIPAGGGPLPDASLNSDAFNGLLARTDFCIKCEFPSELRSYNLHELSMTDFRLCGDGYAKAPSDSRIGLTIAIVIILALFFIIVIVIIIYRKKSNSTYYPNEDLDKLDGDATGVKKPIFSISSSVDQEGNFDGATDYSSPPMSQSYDGSYDDEERDDDEDEEEDEDDEEEDEEDDDLDDEEEDEEEFEDEDEEEDDDDDLDDDEELIDDENDEEQQEVNKSIDKQRVPKLVPQSSTRSNSKRSTSGAQALSPSPNQSTTPSPAPGSSNAKQIGDENSSVAANSPNTSPTPVQQQNIPSKSSSSSLTQTTKKPVPTPSGSMRSSFERQNSLIRPGSSSNTIAMPNRSPANSEANSSERFEHVARTGQKVKKFTDQSRPSSRGGPRRRGQIASPSPAQQPQPPPPPPAHSEFNSNASSTLTRKTTGSQQSRLSGRAPSSSSNTLISSSNRCRQQQQQDFAASRQTPMSVASIAMESFDIQDRDQLLEELATPHDQGGQDEHAEVIDFRALGSDDDAEFIIDQLDPEVFENTTTTTATSDATKQQQRVKLSTSGRVKDRSLFNNNEMSINSGKNSGAALEMALSSEDESMDQQVPGDMGEDGRSRMQQKLQQQDSMADRDELLRATHTAVNSSSTGSYVGSKRLSKLQSSKSVQQQKSTSSLMPTGGESSLGTSGRIVNSPSNHSALTQTSSQDLAN